MTTIKVYSDIGVYQDSLKDLLSELSAWNTSLITSKEIVNTSWESDTSLLIIPGGRDIPYHVALKGKGNARIRSFVNNGGSFLGICAGAYYGCRNVEFDRGTPLEVVGERELAFFPGIARGPAYGPGTFRYNSDDGARASTINDDFHQESFKTFHNGGCYFADTQKYPDVRVLAKYLDISDHPAAIIECSFGRGRAILSGVHIEIGVSNNKISMPVQIKTLLQPYESERKRYLDKLINHLLNMVSEHGL